MDDKGWTGSTAYPIVADDQEISYSQALTVVAAGVRAYCPWNDALLDS